MKKTARSFLALVLTVCVCAGLMCALPVSASADSIEIPSVAITAGYYDPVALGPVKAISATSRTAGCTATDAKWATADGSAIGEVYPEKDLFIAVITVTANDGYTFPSGVTAAVNNKAAEVTRSDDGSYIVVRLTVNAIFYKPIIYTQPTKASADEGGKVSFLASAGYCTGSNWMFLDKDRVTEYTFEEMQRKFPDTSFLGEHDQKMVINNIPAEMDGMRAFCRFTNKYTYQDSYGADIVVKADPNKPAPTPEPTPTPEPEESPAPEETPSEAPAEEPEEAVEPEPSPKPQTDPEADAPSVTEHEHVFSTQWYASESSHWHTCECGEICDQADHSFNWTVTRAAGKNVPGEEQGVCSVCGYITSRAIEPTADDGGLNVLWLIGFGIIGLVAVIIVSMIAEEKKRRKRRRRKHSSSSHARH